MELPGFVRVLAVSALVVSCWAAISLVLAWLSGWSALARHYAQISRFDGERFSFQSAQFRGWFGYNASLSVGANPFGLHLSVWPIFRIGHPPLFVPWSEVAVCVGKRWWVRVARLRFAKAPAIPVLISRRLAEKLESRSASQFSVPSAV